MGSIGIPLDKLPDIVIGRDRSFARGEAMAQLATSNHPQRESLLAQVLQNRSEKPAYRAAAAIALGRIPTPAAERLLIRNLSNPDEHALPEVLLSLGRIGGREALAAIDALKLPGGHHGRRAAAFAAALISCRLGLPGHELSLPEDNRLLKPAAGEARPIDVHKLEAEQARRVVEDLKRYPHGVDLETAAVTRLHCAGEVNAVCLNREFAASGGLSKASQRKALLAVVALQSPETGDYSVSYLILTNPRASSGPIEILAARCTGAIALAGTGRLAGDRLEFELRSVRRPGALAISIRGTVANGIVQATEAISSTTREPRKTVSRVVVEVPHLP